MALTREDQYKGGQLYLLMNKNIHSYSIQGNCEGLFLSYTLLLNDRFQGPVLRNAIAVSISGYQSAEPCHIVKLKGFMHGGLQAY